MYSTSCSTLEKRIKSGIDKIVFNMDKSSILKDEREKLDKLTTDSFIEGEELRTKIRHLEYKLKVMKADEKAMCKSNAMTRMKSFRVSQKINEIIRKNQELTIKVNYTDTILGEMKRRKKNDTGIVLVELKNKLPSDVLCHIREFLPYDIQFHLLESRYKPFKLMKNLELRGLNAVWCKIIDNSIYLSTLPKEKVLSYGKNRKYLRELGILPWHKKNLIIDELTMGIYDMKEKCPELAMKILRMLSILIAPKKKYDTSMEKLRKI
jgi:hypothetical protein